LPVTLKLQSDSWAQGKASFPPKTSQVS